MPEAVWNSTRVAPLPSAGGVDGGGGAGRRRDGRRQACDRRVQHVDDPAVPGHVDPHAVAEHRDAVHRLDEREVVRAVDRDVVAAQVERGHVLRAEPEDGGLAQQVPARDRRRRRAARAVRKPSRRATTRGVRVAASTETIPSRPSVRRSLRTASPALAVRPESGDAVPDVEVPRRHGPTVLPGHGRGRHEHANAASASRARAFRRLMGPSSSRSPWSPANARQCLPRSAS